jgi:hypothetical protein
MNLDELERQVLRRARRAMEPPPGAATATQSALLHRIEHAPAEPVATDGVHLATGPAVGTAAALIGAGFVAGWLAHGTAASVPHPVEPPASVASAAAMQELEQPTPQMPPIPSAEEAPTPRPPAPTVVRAAVPAVPSASSGPLEASTLLEEARLLQKAERALRGGDAAAALYLLEELDRTIPQGKLHQERRAARLLAQCSYEPSVVSRTAARSFLLQNPASVYAERIRAACRIERDE